LPEIVVMKNVTRIEKWIVKQGDISQEYYVHYLEGDKKSLTSIQWRDGDGIDHKISYLDLRAIQEILKMGEYKL